MIEYINNIFKPTSSIIVNRKIFKKFFYQNENISKSNKDIIKNKIENIYLLYKINKSKYKIDIYKTKEYKYKEISYIYVEVKDIDKINKIIELFHKIIIEPDFLILNSENKLKFSICNKKINLNDNSKRVIQDIINTDFIKIEENNYKDNEFLNSLNINKNQGKDLFSFYQNIKDKIINYNASKILKNITENPNKNYEILNKIEEKELELNKLKKEIQKKDINFNYQVELNIKIKELEKEIEELKNY